MIEEGEDQGRVEIREGQRGRGSSGTLLSEVEQELEGVAVARNGMGAGPPFRDKASLKEVL
jgi:hypothetical protein